MVAIVGGAGLGLFNSSAQTLGQRGTFGSAANGRSGEQLAINIANGNLVVQGQDGFLASQGSDIASVRTYNSQGLASDDNGDNWASAGFAQRLFLSGGVNAVNSTITRTERDGASALYVYNTSSKKYISTDGDGAYDQIVATVSNGAATGYTWQDGSSRASAKYNANGFVQSSSDASGNTLTYTWREDNPALLDSITDAKGGFLQYSYSGNLLTKVLMVSPGEPGRDQSSIRHAVYYGYDSNNRLEQVTVDLSPDDNAIADGKIYVTRYTYDGSSTRLASISQSDGSSMRFAYEFVRGSWRIASTTDGENVSMRFNYDDPASTLVSHGLGQSMRYAYNSKGELTSVSVAAPGSNVLQQQVAYEYDSKGNVKSVLDAYQNKTRFEYDANGNQTLVVDANGSETVRSFGSKNQLLSETVYVAAPSGGMQPVPEVPEGESMLLELESESMTIGLDLDPNTGPDSALVAATTYYVYNSANLLRFRLSAEGRVLENRYDANGNLTATIQYNGNRFDTSALGGFLIPNESLLTSWLQNTSPDSRVDKTQTSRYGGVIDIALPGGSALPDFGQ